jgi:AI-2 transport protein TqsA
MTGGPGSSGPEAPETAPERAGAAGRRPRALLLLNGAGSAVLVVAGLRAFSGTLGPAFLALVLVVVVHPLQARLQRRGVPGWLAVTALLAVIYAFVLGLAGAIGWSVARLAGLLPSYSDQFVVLQEQVLGLLGRAGVDPSQLSQAVTSINPNRVIDLAQALLSTLTTGLTDFLFVLLLLFFLALDAAVFPALLAQAAWSHPDAVAALTEFAAGTRRFLVVSTVFGVVVAVLDIGALYWLAVPLPLLWGLLSFITNYIANIGYFVGIVPPVLVALLADGPQTALVLAVVYTAINVVVQGLVQPKVLGNAVGLSATLTFVSVVFWGFALGSIGALLAVPLSLLVRAVLVDADPSARWLLPLISGTPSGVQRRGSRMGRARGAGASLAPPDLAPPAATPAPAPTRAPD